MDIQYEGYPRKVVNDALGCQISTDVRNSSVEKGRLFQAFHKQSIPAGATFNMSFKTPIDIDIRDMPSVINTSADKLTFQYFEGATVTGGTAVPIFCQNRQVATQSTVVMKQGVTVTTTGTQLAQVWMAGSAGVGQSRSGTQGGGGDTFWKLKKDTTYLLRFINESTGANVMQLNEIWVEGL